MLIKHACVFIDPQLHSPQLTICQCLYFQETLEESQDSGCGSGNDTQVCSVRVTESSDELFNSVTIGTIISTGEHLHKDTETQTETVNPAQLITKCIHSQPGRLKGV